VPGYGNGRAAMLTPAKAQSSSLRRIPLDIDLTHIRFESAMFERIRAKLMQRRNLPPVPTERGVRISRTTLFGSWFTALRASAAPDMGGAVLASATVSVL
jgi:hypothetical protein